MLKNRTQEKSSSGTMDLFVSRIMEALKQVRPNLLADGGDIEFVAIENGILKVRLKGTCADCPMSDITLRYGVESVIKEKIPEIRKVEPVQV
jgi:Fe-S cluster biogenesis protein NfuA